MSIMSNTANVQYAPLPTTDLIESVSSFEFLQQSLQNPSSKIHQITIVTFKISTHQLVNGWNQEDGNINKIIAQDAQKLSITSSSLIQTSQSLSSQDPGEVELLRIRYDTKKELFIIPDLQNDLGISVIIEKRAG